jgi:hypothetical protein
VAIPLLSIDPSCAHNLDMTTLRRISIYVDEAELGQFGWFLLERGVDGVAWAGIGSSPEAFDSWVEAFDAGCVELFRLTDDERVGPRHGSPPV